MLHPLPVQVHGLQAAGVQERLAEPVQRPGEEEEKIDVGAGIEKAAAVAAVGDEGDIAGRGALEEGGLEEVLEDPALNSRERLLARLDALRDAGGLP